MKFNRYHTEIAEQYFLHEYLDYADNDWYNRQHMVRVLIPIIERLFISNATLATKETEKID